MVFQKTIWFLLVFRRGLWFFFLFLTPGTPALGTILAQLLALFLVGFPVAVQLLAHKCKSHRRHWGQFSTFPGPLIGEQSLKQLSCIFIGEQAHLLLPVRVQ